jgi:hypothetical protein
VEDSVPSVQGRGLKAVLSRLGRAVIPFIGQHYLLFAVSCLAMLVLARTDDWLYRNEVFAWMSGGVDFDTGHPSLDVLVEAAVENCRSVTGAALEVCRDYQNTLKGSSFFLHPMNAIAGAGLPSSYGRAPWLEDLHMAAVSAQLLGGFLAIGLWLLFVFFLPGPSRVLVTALSLLLLLMGHYRDEASLVLPDPFADGVQIWEAIALPLIAGIFLFGSRLLRRYQILGGVDLPDLIANHRKRIVQVLLAAVVLNFALPPIGAALPQLVAFSALLVAIWWLTSSKSVSPWLVGCILVFLFIMVSGDHLFILRKLEVSKRQLSLVVGIYIAYLAVRPRGRLCWLLPAFAVFHVPAMAILGLALFLAELPICLRRLRVSPLLGVSVVSFAAAYWFMQQSVSSLGDASKAEVLTIALMVWRDPQFWPTLVVAGLIAGLSIWPLFRSDDGLDHLVRCGFLALQCVGAIFLAFAILNAIPESRLSPGVYELVQVHKFLGPPLSFGIVLSLSILLFRATAPHAVASQPSPGESTSHWRQIAPVLGVILLMGLAKINFVPRLLVFDALRNVAVYVIQAKPHDKWCAYLSRGAGFDDHYILSREKPTNGIENAFSALKLKLRIALGRHDPKQMKVSIVGPEEAGCRDPG